MKKNHKIFFAFLILVLSSLNLHAVNIKEIKELLKQNQNFESIDFCLLRESLFNPMFDIDINLKDGKTISFACVDKHGGGKYCCIKAIGKNNRYNFLSRVTVDNKPVPSDGLNFIDLSFLLGTKIINISDAIDKYDAIYNIAEEVAKQEYVLGTEKMLEVYYSWNKQDFENCNSFIYTNGRRTVKCFVTTKYGPWNKDWIDYLPEDFWDDE